MDKGKSIAATTSQGIGVSSKEKGEIRSDSDDERGAAAGRGGPRVDERASSSTSTAGGGGGGASSSSKPSATTQAIAPFEHGQFVRLRNRGRGGYLFASDNGRDVCVDGRRGMVNTAWVVQILRADDDTACVLFRSAYGGYLRTTHYSAGFGLVGCRTVQFALEYPDNRQIEWSTTTGKRGSVVLLQGTDAGVMALRANGRYQRWNTDVTSGPVNLNHVSSMMEWEVQVIPLTLERPPYQPNAAITRLPKGCEERIEVLYCHAWFGDNGSVEHEMWTLLRFRGRSLIRLRNEIAKELGVQPGKMVLFTQAGFLGQPIPLLPDLHLRDDTRMILAFMIDSPGYNALRFPDLAAE